MSDPRVFQLDSLEQLRGAAAAWDDLWQRSDVDLPVLRAELVAQCVECLGPAHGFRALVVEQSGQWMAALPLVPVRRLRVLDVGALPTNRWGPAGRLLLDPTADAPRVLDRLLASAGELPWGVLWLDHIPLDLPSARAFQAAIARRGMEGGELARYQVAWLDIDHDWARYRRTWSHNFRRQLTRRARRLAEQGDLRFELCSPLDAGPLEAQLRRGFEIEDRNWKGRASSSVIARRLFPFYLRQARQLARWGYLRLAFLELDDRPIAFAYGMAAKGVFHLAKIGYDEHHAKFGPGNLLLERLYQDLWSDPTMQAVDSLGEITDDQLRWQPQRYRVGRVVVAGAGLSARAVAFAHQHLWPPLRRWRRRLAGRPTGCT